MSDAYKVSSLEQRIAALEASVRMIPGAGIGRLAAFSAGSCTNECTAACTIGCTKGCTGSCVAEQIERQAVTPGIRQAGAQDAAGAGVAEFDRLAKRSGDGD